MPEKNLQLSNITISIISFISIIIGFISSYVAIVLKNINQKFDNSKEKDIELLDKIKELKEALNEAFNRIRDLENILNVIKTEHDINHKRK